MRNSNEILFNETNHTYTNKVTGQTYLSVTQLLKKHNLSTNYANVDADVLAKAAAKGTMIHEEIEAFIKRKEIGFTSEQADFINLCGQNFLVPDQAEYIVYSNEYGIAGTVDLSGVNVFSNMAFIGDNKTTFSLNKEALAWQLSIYAFLASDGQQPFDELEFYGFHLLPDHKSRVVKIEPKPKEEVVKLLEAEKNGQIYQQKNLQLQASVYDAISEIEKTIAAHQNQIKTLESQLSTYKTAIKNAMEDNNVKKFENELMTITYIAPTTRTSIDSERLKKECPEIADKYSKKTNIKSNIRITLKGE